MRRILEENDLLPFGKYNDKTLKWVLENDPEYLSWFETIDKTHKFSADVQRKLLIKLSK